MCILEFQNNIVVQYSLYVYRHILLLQRKRICTILHSKINSFYSNTEQWKKD